MRVLAIALLAAILAPGLAEAFCETFAGARCADRCEERAATSPGASDPGAGECCTALFRGCGCGPVAPALQPSVAHHVPGAAAPRIAHAPDAGRALEGHPGEVFHPPAA